MKRNALIAIGIFLAGVLVGSLHSETDLQAQDKKAAQHAGHKMTGDMQKDMQMMNKMMVDHLGEMDEQYEARFIDMMVPHHEGAVMMAEHSLEHANRDELKQMSKKMIQDQKKEIDQLKQWRKEWYGAAKAKARSSS